MQLLRKISAILLSLMVLLSSTSFTVNMHLCMGKLDNIALFKAAKSCDMEVKAAECTKENHAPKEEYVSNKNCCEDQSFLIEGQDEFQQTSSVSVPDWQFLAVLYKVFSVFFSQLSDTYVSYEEYSPPLIKRDIPVLVQSFLL